MSVSTVVRGARVRLGEALRVLASFAAAILIGAAIMWPLVSERGPTQILRAAVIFGLPSLLLATTLAVAFGGSRRGCLVALSLVAPFFAAAAYVAFVLAFDFEGLGRGAISFFTLTGSFPAAVLGFMFASIAAVIFYCWDLLRGRRRARPAAGEGEAS